MWLSSKVYTTRFSKRDVSSVLDPFHGYNIFIGWVPVLLLPNLPRLKEIRFQWSFPLWHAPNLEDDYIFYPMNSNIVVQKSVTIKLNFTSSTYLFRQRNNYKYNKMLPSLSKVLGFRTSLFLLLLEVTVNLKI